MELMQIGKFITELRKEYGFTQEQLGEKIGVTNKTISRWETGTYLPPVEALLMLSELYNVSINEILSGKRLSKEEYKEVTEANLNQTIKTNPFSLKEKIAYFKKKWLKEHKIMMLLCATCILGVFIAGLILKEPLLVACAMILFVVGHAYRNNSMMTYVEQNAFDGRGWY